MDAFVLTSDRTGQADAGTHGRSKDSMKDARGWCRSFMWVLQHELTPL